MVEGATTVIDPRLQEDSENYFSKSSNGAGENVLQYETRIRELHNMIAIMVVGEKRSGMNENLATRIANFAMEYSKSV